MSRPEARLRNIFQIGSLDTDTWGLHDAKKSRQR